MRISNIGSAQIEIFATLVESGGFSEAAQRLGLTQSAVSHGLARLETELGVVLVERGRRGVVLTAAGQAVLPQAREVLARLEAVRQAAVTAGGPATGKLRVGLGFPLVSPGALVSLVSRFRDQYPGVELILMDGVAREVEGWLGEGLVDIGLVTAPSIPGIDIRPLYQDTLCVLVQDGYKSAAVEMPDLSEEVLLMPRFGRQLQGELLQRRRADTHEEGRSPLRHFVSDISTIIELAHAGVGVALLPSSVIPNALSGLQVLKITPPFPIQIGLGVARSWDSASPVARLFAETAEIWARENGLAD